MNDLVVSPGTIEKIQECLLKGNLEPLTPAERLGYLHRLCQDFGGLNPLTKPFDLIRLPPDKAGNRKLIPYVTKDGGAQLRKRFGISLKVLGREFVQDTYRVVVQASTSDGRVDEDVGAVPTKGSSGADLANLLMKAETKAKRRATLSITGLGFLDEEELDTMGPVQKEPVDIQAIEAEVIEKRPTIPLGEGVPSVEEIVRIAAEVGIDEDRLKESVGAKDLATASLTVRRALWNLVQTKKGKSK